MFIFVAGAGAGSESGTGAPSLGWKDVQNTSKTKYLRQEILTINQIIIIVDFKLLVLLLATYL